MVTAVNALDRSGCVPLMALTLLLSLACIPMFTITWVQAFAGWKHRGLLSFVPPLVVLAALPAGVALGPPLLDLRFRWNRAEYDCIARQVVDGTYPARLRPEHQHLAYVVHSETLDGVVQGASLIVVSHGFAGHEGFFYATDPTNLRRLIRGDTANRPNWYLSHQLSEHWAVVRD